MCEERKLALKERTVYVGGFDRDSTTLDELLEFFEGGYEKVVHVRMRRHRVEGPYREDQDPGRFLGSCFVTFANRQSAEKFLTSAKGIMYKGRKLVSKWEKEFFSEKSENNDLFKPESIHETVWVHGFDRQDTSQEELAEYFGQFDGCETVRKRVFRDRAEDPWFFSGSVFVTFETKEFAEEFMGIKDLTFHGDRLVTKSQLQFYKSRNMFKRDIARFEENHNWIFGRLERIFSKVGKATKNNFDTYLLFM